MITNAGTFHCLHVILTSFKFVFKLSKHKLKIMLKLTSIQMQANNIKLSYNYTFCHLHAVTWHHAQIIHAVKFGTNYFPLILFIPTGFDWNHFVDLLPKAVLEEI